MVLMPRRDSSGALSAGHLVGIAVAIMIALLVGYILIPVVSNAEFVASKNISTVGNATRTGIPGASGLLPLGPIMFILTVVVIAVVGVLIALKEAD